MLRRISSPAFPLFGLLALVALTSCASSEEEPEAVDQQMAGQYGNTYSGVSRDIPHSAILLRDWQGSRLTYTAPSNGYIYIYDATSSRLVYSNYLKQGDEFTFASDTGRATINGRTVFDAGGVQHFYQVYFDPEQ